MLKKEKYSSWIAKLLISVAISLIVNFSYFVFWIVAANQPADMKRMPPFHSMPDMEVLVSLQVLYYIVLSFILLYVFTTNFTGQYKVNFTKRLVVCVAITLVLYFLTPYSSREGDLMPMLNANRFFNPMAVLKSSFTLIVAALYAKIYELVYQRQSMVIENQRLKNESLENRYNMLVGQINPHFLFNSLNSLSMLVRQTQTDKAIEYIDHLSDTFRYIIKNGQIGMATVEEELRFADDYKYLHEIRYADKLFFKIDVPQDVRSCRIPTLSLLPLIENAVKHNTITSAKPFTITIAVEDGYIVVKNPIIPKITPADGTGIGLKNMSSRYKLLTGKNIVIEDGGDDFIVRLPLICD